MPFSLWNFLHFIASAHQEVNQFCNYTHPFSTTGELIFHHAGKSYHTSYGKRWPVLHMIFEDMTSSCLFTARIENKFGMSDNFMKSYVICSEENPGLTQFLTILTLLCCRTPLSPWARARNIACSKRPSRPQTALHLQKASSQSPSIQDWKFFK